MALSTNANATISAFPNTKRSGANDDYGSTENDGKYAARHERMD
jgi:hypothetical protein